MRTLTKRLKVLEGKSSDHIRKWHHIVVDSVTEEQAIADYEERYGPTKGDGLLICTIIDPRILAA